MWDTRFDERDVKEIRTKTTTYLGVGAIAKMDDIAADLKARGIDSILCVTGGHSYKLTGAWDYVTAACAKHGIRISLYDKVTPNPTTDSIDEAAALGRSADAKDGANPEASSSLAESPRVSWRTIAPIISR